MNFLCKIGIHKWLIRYPSNFWEAERKCSRCGMFQSGRLRSGCYDGPYWDWITEVSTTEVAWRPKDANWKPL